MTEYLNASRREGIPRPADAARVERALRLAMDEHTRRLVLPPGAARTALGRARRTQQTRIVGSVAALALVGAGVTTATGYRFGSPDSTRASGHPSSTPGTRSIPGDTGTGSASPAGQAGSVSVRHGNCPTVPSRVARRVLPSEIPDRPSPQLLAICLEDPARGFPLRLAPDQFRPGPSAWGPGVGWELVILVGTPVAGSAGRSPASVPDVVPASSRTASISVVEYTGTADIPNPAANDLWHSITMKHGWRAQLDMSPGVAQLRFRTPRFVVTISTKGLTTGDDVLALVDALQNLS